MAQCPLEYTVRNKLKTGISSFLKGEVGQLGNPRTTSFLPVVLLKKSRYRFEELTSVRVYVEVGVGGSASRHIHS